MAPLHIVCYAPYTNWSIHSARQITILQALRLRGCSVTYVACDGVFGACDIIQGANGGAIAPGDRACLVCQSSAAARLAAWGMPYRWFGRWLHPSDTQIADRWVSALASRDYLTAEYTAAVDGRPDDERWHIGAWVRSSVHTHLRHNVLDLSDPAVAEVYRTYMHAGLMAAFGLSRLFAREKPQAQLLFNGRMGPTRVALELAKQRGIHSLVEERATVSGRVTLFEDTTCIDTAGMDALWEQWRNVPLTAEEIAEVGAELEARRRGTSTDVSVFSRAADNAGALYRQLGLDPQRPVWALFSSSLDESVDEPRAVGAFPTQTAWIDATVAEAQCRPDVQLVIRVHPNTGGKRSLGHNKQDEAFFAGLASRLPANVRLVGAEDDVSSYTLAVIADLGLVWYSTIGLEMAALGKPVVRSGSSWLAYCDAFVPVENPAGYSAAIDTALRHTPQEQERCTVQAWRFAYCWSFRHTLPFPLVKQPAWHAGEPAYKTLDALAPGKDATLDHICAVIMDRRTLHALPDVRPAAFATAEAANIRDRIVAYRDEAA